MAIPTPTIYTLCLVPILCLTLWLLTSFFTSTSFPVPTNLRGKRIVLLIAHPDDEAMFFAPSLLALTRKELGNHVKILCLSTGDAEGLGEIRKRELSKSARMLGFGGEADVSCLDDKRFRDGPRQSWKAEDVREVLEEAFAIGDAKGSERKTMGGTENGIGPNSRHSATASPGITAATDKPTSSVDILITFDPSGISSHPNHIACFHGSCLFLKALTRDYLGYTCPVTLYTLPTVSILRKYSFVFDTLLTMFLGALCMSGGSDNGTYRTRGKEERRTERVLFVSGFRDYVRARAAMVNAHKSQMVWFRWGWITLGRYMVVNELRRERVVGA